MCGTDLESREPIERAFKYEVRKRDRRFERIPDRIAEHAVPRKPAGQFWRPLRVDEDQDAELFGFGPKRVKPGVRKFFTVDTGTDSGAAQSVLLDPVL